MIRRIKKYKRFEDYYAINCFEVKAALFLTFFSAIFFFIVLDFYQSFIKYQEALQQIFLAVIGGDFTLLGMSLAGMAIITSMFSLELIKIINKVDKNDVINRILSQFEFSALNLGIQITCFVFLYFLILSEKKLVNFYIFLILFVLIVYHFFFNLFYIIALIGNCIRINEIKNTCNKIVMIDKTEIDVANEMRIDYILAILLKEMGISRDQLLDDLSSMIEKSSIEEKQRIKDYLMSYYRSNKR